MNRCVENQLKRDTEWRLRLAIGVQRHWSVAAHESRQSFLNGALTRLIDPDAILRQQVVEFRRSRVEGSVPRRTIIAPSTYPSSRATFPLTTRSASGGHRAWTTASSLSRLGT